jgi:hypothetical protein
LKEIQVKVIDNDIEKAMRILKKKIQNNMKKPGRGLIPPGFFISKNLGPSGPALVHPTGIILMETFSSSVKVSGVGCQ